MALCSRSGDGGLGNNSNNGGGQSNSSRRAVVEQLRSTNNNNDCWIFTGHLANCFSGDLRACQWEICAISISYSNASTIQAHKQLMYFMFYLELCYVPSCRCVCVCWRCVLLYRTHQRIDLLGISAINSGKITAYIQCLLHRHHLL